MDWSWSITAIGSGTGGQTPPRPTGLGFNPYQDTWSWYSQGPKIEESEAWKEWKKNPNGRVRGMEEWNNQRHCPQFSRPESPPGPCIVCWSCVALPGPGQQLQEVLVPRVAAAQPAPLTTTTTHIWSYVMTITERKPHSG